MGCGASNREYNFEGFSEDIGVCGMQVDRPSRVGTKTGSKDDLHKFIPFWEGDSYSSHSGDSTISSPKLTSVLSPGRVFWGSTSTEENVVSVTPPKTDRYLTQSKSLSILRSPTIEYFLERSNGDMSGFGLTAEYFPFTEAVKWEGKPPKHCNYIINDEQELNNTAGMVAEDPRTINFQRSLANKALYTQDNANIEGVFTDPKILVDDEENNFDDCFFQVSPICTTMTYNWDSETDSSTSDSNEISHQEDGRTQSSTCKLEAISSVQDTLQSGKITNCLETGMHNKADLEIISKNLHMLEGNMNKTTKRNRDLRSFSVSTLRINKTLKKHRNSLGQSVSILTSVPDVDNPVERLIRGKQELSFLQNHRLGLENQKELLFTAEVGMTKPNLCSSEKSKRVWSVDREARSADSNREIPSKDIPGS